MAPTTRRRAWAARSPRLPGLLAAPLVGVLVAAGAVPVPGPSSAAAEGDLGGAVGAEIAGAVGGAVGGAIDGTVGGKNGVSAAVPAQTEARADGLRILLDEVEPVVLRPGRSVTLRGRLVNEGPAVNRTTLLTVSAAPVPLGSRAEVAGWVEGTDARSAPWLLGDDALGAVIPAGGEEMFEVTVPGSALDALPAAPAVLGVELVVSVENETDRAPQSEEVEPAVLRTVLTSSGQPLEVDVPLETTWVVPLTLPADAALSSPDDSAHAAAWLAAVGRDSVVRDWLDHLSIPQVTWWVDPAALVAHRPAEGLAVATPDEPDEPGETDGPVGPGEPGETDGPVGPEEPGETDGPVGPEEPGETGDPEDSEPTGPSETTAPADPTEAPDDPTPTETSTEAAGGMVTDDPEAVTSAPTEGSGEDGTDQTSSPDSATTTAPVPVPPPTPEPEPEPAPEPEVQTLAAALAELRQALGEVDPELLWWLPPDDPDVAVLSAEDTDLPANLASELLTRWPEGAPAEVTELLGRGRDDVAWPMLAAPTADDLAALVELYEGRPDGAGPLGAVLVPRESFTADSTAPPRLGAVPLTEVPDVLALGADSWTSALVTASSEEAEEHGAGAAAQRVLAHTLGTWHEAPQNQRTLVIAPPRGSAVPADVLDQLSDGWAQARWLTAVSADEVLDRAPDLDPVGLSGVAPQEVALGPLADLLLPLASPMSSSRAADHVELQEELDGLAQILRDTDSLRSWEPVLDAQWSTRWRQDETAWVYLWRSLRHEVRSTRNGVYLLPSNVNFLADQGVIHLTVVNDLPVAVEGVRLRAQPTNGRLQITGQPEPVDVGPGSRASVPFQARAITRGETVLQVRVSTPSGTVLGEEAEVSVRVQPTGVWIYWVLGGLAGIVLVLGLRRALTSEPRRTSPAPAGSGTAYPDSSPSPSAKENPQ